MTNLFKIGPADFTPWEQTDKHVLNRVDVYESWTDGNWTDHRVIARTRFEGSVVLSFSRTVNYTAFLNTLEQRRTPDGYYYVSVYCSDTGQLESFAAFLDVEGATKFDVTCPRIHQTITVNITER